MRLGNLVQRLACVALLALAAACGGGGGGGSSTSAPTTPGQASARSSFSINSAHASLNYTVQVYLPPAYSQGTGRFPVVYVMDGEYRFTPLADILERTNRQFILVAIGNMGDRRWIDFTMPTGEAYYRFLTQELIPNIDSRYRTDPANRILCGHSLSGLFAMYALYLERPGQRYFSAFIPEDASLWADAQGRFLDPLTAEPAASMEREMFQRDRNLPVGLALSADTMGNNSRVQPVHDFLAQRGYQGLRLQMRTYSLGHLGMDGIGFEESLTFLFGRP